MSRRLTLEQFAAKATIVHGMKYDYNRVTYVNARTRVTIICPEHGAFEQTPDTHLSGKGCRKCNWKGHPLIDMTGRRCGRLLPLQRADNQGRKVKWLCLCNPEWGGCGKQVIVNGSNLRRGLTQSCGCLCFKHGKSHTSTYLSYKGMIQRCIDPRSPRFPKYGGSGVTFTDSWHPKNEGFVAFLRDMGERSEGTTLGRYLDSGPYTSWNAEWQTPEEQAAQKCGATARKAWHERRAIIRQILRKWRKKFQQHNSTAVAA